VDHTIHCEQVAHIERCREVLKRRLDWLEIYELIYPGDMLDPSRLKWFCESDNRQVVRHICCFFWNPYAV